MLCEAYLLGVAGVEVLDRDAPTQILRRYDAGSLGQTEEPGLLSIYDGFGAGNVRLEGPHLRGLQSEPQP